MQNTRLAEAETDYQQAAKAAPNDPRPHVALGGLYVFEQKAPQAEGELMKALELDPRNAHSHAALGGVYGTIDQPGLAEAQYRAAVALDPANTDYRVKLGAVLQKQGKVGAAEAEYRTAVGLEPRNAHAHLALADLLHAEANRQNEAESEYAQVRALDSSLMPSATGAKASASPAGAVTTTVASASGAPAGEVPQLKDFNRRFLLTHDSPVYDSMSNGARVVGQVHRGKWVRVTAIGGPWFRVQLRNGTVGFIPVTTAE